MRIFSLLGEAMSVTDGGACCCCCAAVLAGSTVVATSDFNADFGGAAPFLPEVDRWFEESGEGENACAEATNRITAVAADTFTIMYKRFSIYMLELWLFSILSCFFGAVERQLLSFASIGAPEFNLGC